MWNTCVRDGVGVTAPVVKDSFATYTPGVSERRNGVSTFSHSGIKNHDAQSVAAQTISATREYDAFGNVASSFGSWSGPFGYGGPYEYQEDSETDYKLLGHRYYDPTTGRFLTRDKAKDGRNWYAYCDNNPLTYADLTGAIVLGIVCGAQAGAGVCASATIALLYDVEGGGLLLTSTIGGGIGAGGYAGAGGGLVVDPWNGTTQGCDDGFAVGIATPVGGWECQTTDPKSGRFAQSVLVGPGGGGMAYAERRYVYTLAIPTLGEFRDWVGNTYDWLRDRYWRRQVEAATVLIRGANP